MTKYCIAILHHCFVLSSNFKANFETWSKTSKFQMVARYFGGKPIIDGLVFPKQKAWQATKARGRVLKHNYALKNYNNF